MAAKRVLIVDDALDLGRLLQNTLVAFDQSMSVKVVPSAEEAILEIGISPLDLLVSDIRLPGISGIDLIRRVRNRYPAVKVIAITALSDETIMDQARTVADVFLQKPLDIYEFVDHSQRLLGLPRTTQKPVLPAAEVTLEPTGGTNNRVVDILAGLRGSLGAIAAALLDERGHVVVQAGDLPGGFEEQVSPSLMAALSAGSKVAGALGNPPLEFAQAFRGKNYNLVCAPVFHYVLVAALKVGKNTLRLSIGVEGVLEASRELAPTLEELGMIGERKKTAPLSETLEPSIAQSSEMQPPLAPASEPKAGAPAAEDKVVNRAIAEGGGAKDPDIKAFEALLQQPGLKLSPQELDDFWNNAQPAQKPLLSPDALSFDQARKLGLAPGEEPQTS